MFIKLYVREICLFSHPVKEKGNLIQLCGLCTQDANGKRVREERRYWIQNITLHSLRHYRAESNT